MKSYFLQEGWAQLEMKCFNRHCCPSIQREMIGKWLGWLTWSRSGTKFCLSNQSILCKLNKRIKELQVQQFKLQTKNETQKKNFFSASVGSEVLSFSSVQFSSVAQSCPTFWDPMNRSTPGLPVHHQLPEFTQTHVHQVSDAIQPSHPLSSRSPPTPNPSQHHSLFQWVISSHEVAKVLEFQL